MEKDKIKILEAIARYDSIKSKEIEFEKKKYFWIGVSVAMVVQLLIFVWFKVI